MRFRGPLVGAALLAVGACTSVPLSTIARFSSFDETQFAKLDPMELRVRVSMPPDFVLDAPATRLSTAIRFGATIRRDDFRLQQVSLSPSSRRGGILSPDIPVASYELRLAEASVGAFREMQGLARPGAVQDVDMNVRVSLKDGPREAKSLRVWVELLRSREEGWITLVDGGTIEINRTAKYGRKE